MDVVLAPVQDDVVAVEEEDVEVVRLATLKRWMKSFFFEGVVGWWNAFTARGWGVLFYSGGVWIKIPGLSSRFHVFMSFRSTFNSILKIRLCTVYVVFSLLPLLLLPFPLLLLLLLLPNRIG